MVLLQNNGILPWCEKNLSGKTMAVIGELAAIPCLGDHGSSRVSPPDITTFLDGLRQRAAADIRIVYHDGKDMAQAADIARRADIVLLAAGYQAEDEGENLTPNRKPVAKPKVPRGGDRASLSLHEEQQQLITTVCDANKNTVVALVAGSAVMMNGWQEKPAAILLLAIPAWKADTPWHASCLAMSIRQENCHSLFQQTKNNYPRLIAGLLLHATIIFMVMRYAIICNNPQLFHLALAFPTPHST
jgi:beta-glucosidase